MLGAMFFSLVVVNPEVLCLDGVPPIGWGVRMDLSRGDK
jgi:hypothetical protein